MSPFTKDTVLQTLAESSRNPGVLSEKERKEVRAATWRSLFDLKEWIKRWEISRRELEIFLDNILIENESLPKKPKSRRERWTELAQIEKANKDEQFASSLNLDLIRKECENLPVIDADASIAESLEKVIKPMISKEHRTDFVVVDGKSDVPLGIVSLRMIADSEDTSISVGELPLAAKWITLSLSDIKKNALELMDTHNVSTLPVVDDRTGALFAVLDRGTETQKDVRSGLVLLSTRGALKNLVPEEKETPTEEESPIPTPTETDVA